MNALIDII